MSVARIEFINKKMIEIGQAMGAAHVWTAPFGPGAPGAHHQGGTRMGESIQLPLPAPAAIRGCAHFLRAAASSA